MMEGPAVRLVRAALQLAACDYNDPPAIDHTGDERVRESARAITEFHEAAMAYAKFMGMK